MRLTASQHEHLQELSIALARPTADSTALVQRGLAEQGHGKFGKWVRITAAGRKEAEKDGKEAGFLLTNSRMMRDRGARAASTVSLRSVKTKDQSMPAAATPLPSAPTCDVPPASQSSQRPAPNAAPVQGRRRRTSRALSDDAAGAASASHRPSRYEACSSGQAAMVDAIRVTRGKRVMYYPMSMSTSIQNGKHCKTGNPFYRSLPVAASTQDREVL